MTYNNNGYNPNRNRDSYRSDQNEDLYVRDKQGTILGFKSTWIIDGADQDMIDYTSAAGGKMFDNKLSSSKIRNIFGEIKRIQMGGYEKNKASFLLLQPKMAYLVGRDSKNIGIRLFRDIFEKASKLVSDEKTYQNFCNLMEALVAYHRFYGGKD